MVFTLVRLLVIVGALCAAARSIYEHPRDIQVTQAGKLSKLTVGEIGWTQNSVSPLVYDVEAQDRVPLKDVVQKALNDPSGADTYLRKFFPDPITVFFHSKSGYLSIDNRRLTIFRLTLPSHTTIPVNIVTEKEAGVILAKNNKKPPAEALAQRLTTKNGGYSIIIRGTSEKVSQGTAYIPSPYVHVSS